MDMTSVEIFKSLRIFIVLAVLEVLILGFFCAGLTNHASMYDNMNAGVMASTNNQKCCNADISKYLGSLKENILVPPRDARDVLILLTLGLVLILIFASSPFRRTLINREQASFRFYTRENPDAALFNHLKLAFSRGILNPKIY